VNAAGPRYPHIVLILSAEIDHRASRASVWSRANRVRIGDRPRFPGQVRANPVAQESPLPKIWTARVMRNRGVPYFPEKSFQEIG